MTTEPLPVIESADGTVQLLEANSPLLLEGADRAWLVQTGAAEIFMITLSDGRQSGPRRHVFTAQTGCTLHGWDLHHRGTETALLAVGLAGTRALQIPLRTLQDKATAAITQPAVVDGVNAWVDGLSAGLLGESHVHVDEQLLPATEVALADGRTAGPKSGVLWITPREGRLRFLDQVDAPAAGAPPFPLAEEAWCRSAGASTVLVQSTDQLAGQDSLWAGLAALHATFLSCWAANRRTEVAEESQQLQAEIAYERAVRAQAVAGLAEAMERGRAQLRIQPGADPLLEACHLVGSVMGISMRAPQSTTAARQSRPLEAIAKASRVRTRRVLLTGQWWREELGPLLAFTREEQHPVALIPTGRRGYTILDPASGETRAAGAGGPALASAAVQFYRPLPPRALTGWEVLRFGLRGCQGDLVRVAIMGAAGGLIALFIPVVTGLIFGQIIPANEPHRLVLIALALAASVFASAVFQITRSVAMLRVEAKVDSSLQPAIWDRLLSLPVPFFRRYTAGDLAQRALGIDAISQVVTGVVTTTVLSSVFSVFSFFLLFLYSVPLALVALGLTLITLAAIGLSGYVQLRFQRQQATLQGQTSGIVLQFLTGMAKLRVAGAEGRAFAVWANYFGRQRRLAVSAQAANNVLNTFMAFWPVVTTMAFFIAIAGTAGPNFVTATYLAFAAAFGQFLAAMLALGGAATLILQIVPFWERAQPILKALPEVDDAKADPGLLNGAIEVRGVSFRYSADGPLVLEDVTIQAEPGEFVALVGPSGSGKSSLLRLLLGFERPETGSIYYDGHDLADLDTEAVRRQIGTVIQSGKLQTGSIFDNIVGAAPLTMDDAWEAARMAGLDEDIRQMPMGMQTVISEGASSFSGGQRQRLLIARAVVSKPRILLFDEATSALDNRTQETVTESLKNLQATRIVIAHRLSTIEDADRVYVIMAGRVVQSGSYRELMAVDGPFLQLARRQIV